MPAGLLMSVEIRELRAFAVAAEEGSLSAAARRLHLSQSALSQTIQSLERQLGVQLLLRSRTGVTATEAGAILLREGRALLAQYDQMLAGVARRDEPAPASSRWASRWNCQPICCPACSRS